MALKPTFRAATLADASSLAVLIDIAGNGLPNKVWLDQVGPGHSALEEGRQVVRRDEGEDSYHNATIAMNEVARTAPGQRTTHLVFDGLGAYPAGVHFLNAQRQKENLPPAFSFTQVFGLENRDDQSAQWRPFKQLIERLNRTYRFHTRAAGGFPSHNGALTLTVLFTTYYNFLRPHTSLHGNAPVYVEPLDTIPTLQARWCKLLDRAMALPDAA